MKTHSNISQLSKVKINNEAYFKIENSNTIRPFFMSIVSSSNHWLFIASNGGLTAGRKNAQFALFPYYTDDKITESAEVTGSKSIFQVTKNNQTHIWEPFSIRGEGRYNCSQNLYKNTYGDKVMFEEVNHDLQLTFRYEWASSDSYGFVKKSTLINNNSKEAVTVTVLDGLQNILPYGVGSDLQNASSNLVDAYKRTELDAASGLGIFALSAIIVDRAEPSEALKCNVVWSKGLEAPTYALSSLQLNAFRHGEALTQETDVKAEKGAYFVSKTLTLPPNAQKEWMFGLNVNQNHAAVVRLKNALLTDADLVTKVASDIALGTKKLIQLNASADGLQLTNDNQRDTRHFANTLFNNMRGGIFDNNYTIEKWDFTSYLQQANKRVFTDSNTLLKNLPEQFLVSELYAITNSSSDTDFKRLCFEYMPLKFSRRHGDPSRPWNKFSINTRNDETGEKVLDYEGNWRDIFQNWEALANAYPEFIESMIHKFLNATTFEGYNPYRVTKSGFDWEEDDPNDPWSYIGYWGDHQIIYLLKFLEFIDRVNPTRLQQLFDKDVFVYANVPYKIKPYHLILQNSKDTIDFDETLDQNIRAKRDELGADGALLTAKDKSIVKVNFIEKILATTLAKVSNFIPEAGIWMNTQRPEWNDANNALVGNGVSMVTLYYLRRFLSFFNTSLQQADVKHIAVSAELAVYFNHVLNTLKTHKHLLESTFTDATRKTVLDGLAEPASQYRTQIYKAAFSGEKSELSLQAISEFTTTALAYLDHSITANKRKDNMYHAYNLMTVTNNGAGISVAYLDEMLEGQVAVLSSKFLNPNQALDVLNSMKNSALFRPDQYSYLLYPFKDLKGFLQRNHIPAEAVKTSKLLMQLVADNNTTVVEQDANGNYHFNGGFKNAADLNVALQALEDTRYSALAITEKQQILDVFETVFNHKAFTGRSGTFYGYEGLGSIYWHMVSKLLLAVQECCLQAINTKASDKVVGQLLEHYYEINAGIGVHKSPQLYGAFPTDPYSHTPAGKGAQQPGMTGQVKEDILSRFGELGVFVQAGQVVFNPCMLRKTEFLQAPQTFNYSTVTGQDAAITLTENQLAFTYCQVPIIYQIATENSVAVFMQNGAQETSNGLVLSKALSAAIFKRNNTVAKVVVSIATSVLK